MTDESRPVGLFDRSQVRWRKNETPWLGYDRERDIVLLKEWAHLPGRWARVRVFVPLKSTVIVAAICLLAGGGIEGVVRL